MSNYRRQDEVSSDIRYVRQKRERRRSKEERERKEKTRVDRDILIQSGCPRPETVTNSKILFPTKRSLFLKIQMTAARLFRERNTQLSEVSGPRKLPKNVVCPCFRTSGLLCAPPPLKRCYGEILNSGCQNWR